MIQKQIRPAFLLTIILMLITGFAYPGLVTALATLMFPRQASGSLVTRDGHVIGSALIGQAFAQPWYFHSRPSAAGNEYDAAASSGTNKGPTDRRLADTLIASAIAEAEGDGAVKGMIPADMVTASASGLDPHISPANAQLQVARVAAARGADPASVRALVERHTEARQLGVFGEPRVNVLELNLALDNEFPRSVAITPGSRRP
jgi:K+-transporting ATPase ATPase C chain